MHPTRVVITGIGLLTGLGGSRESTWAKLRSGRSAITWLDGQFASNEPPYAASKIPGQAFDATTHLQAAGSEAMADAGLDRESAFDPDRGAVVVGMSKGDLGSLCKAHNLLRGDGHESPRVGELWRASHPGYAAQGLAHRFNLLGACVAPIAACATGVIAALRGADLIRQGTCDVVLVGAGDASLNPLVLSSFRRMKALAKVDREPARAIRPWDNRRSGFLPGEGAAVLVLERAEHARARGVLPYAEFAGGAFGSDAYHITDLNPDPSSLAHIIELALQNAQAASTDLQYINVHGTATRQNDPLECRAIRKAIGSHADSVSCSANKAQIGHLLGAAGAAELAITCLALRDGFVPPTLNLDDQDPACDLDGTPHVGKNRVIHTALKISIGFGGHLAAAVIRRPDGARRDGRDGLPLRS